MRFACLTRYDDQGASSRVRFAQYLPLFARGAPELQWSRQSLLDNRYLRARYAGRPYWSATLQAYARRAAVLPSLRGADLWWIEKELWPFSPTQIERAVLHSRRYALDFDDAIFHNYDLHRHAAVRCMYGRKIDLLMAEAALVTAGNEYLAERARSAGAARIEVIPTVVDLGDYPSTSRADDSPKRIDVAWIGTPATVRYLCQVAAPLAAASRRQPLRLVVIGGDPISMPGVDVVVRPWSRASEASELASCHIGIMPLADSPWERGKCGYKLVQYMACGLPVIASPVGVNVSLVRNSSSGMLASTESEWTAALLTLSRDSRMRDELGRAGRRSVERTYSVQAVAPRLLALLKEAAGAVTRAD